MEVRYRVCTDSLPHAYDLALRLNSRWMPAGVDMEADATVSLRDASQLPGTSRTDRVCEWSSAGPPASPGHQGSSLHAPPPHLVLSKIMFQYINPIHPPIIILPYPPVTSPVTSPVSPCHQVQCIHQQGPLKGRSPGNQQRRQRASLLRLPWEVSEVQRQSHDHPR